MSPPSSFEPTPEDADGELDRIAAEILRAADRGECFDVEAAVRRHPAIAAEILAFARDAGALESLVKPAGQSSNGGAASPADKLIGDYEIHEEIAHGGMGVVFRATQRSLGRAVALKVLSSAPVVGASAVERFLHEAKALASLDHPHIVPVHEVGVHGTTYFFAMKLLDGGSLAQSGDRWRQDPAGAARLLEAVARGVHHAHLKGLLHRDLKPANILLDADGTPYVADFGLATALADVDAGWTRSGCVVGTPAYMAPEQASGKRSALTPAADIHALGAILYELLTGRRAFDGATTAAVLHAVEREVPARLQGLNDKVPRDLETICAKCLEKDPRRRYPTAAALADDLDRFLAGAPVEARPVAAVERAWRWVRRHPARAAVAVLLAALAVVSTTAAVFLERERQAARSAEAAAKASLWQSYMDQARLGRASGLAGRRVAPLSALAAAARIRTAPELRGEALSCLGLLDLERERGLPGWSGEVADLSSAVDDAFLKYAYSDARGVIEVRGLEDGKVIERLSGPGYRAQDLGFSADGRLLGANHSVTGETRRRLRVWDLTRPGEPAFETTDFHGARSWAFLPQGGVVAWAAKDGTVRFAALLGGAKPAELPPEGAGSATALAFSRSGRLAAVGHVRGASASHLRLLGVGVESPTARLDILGRTTDIVWHPGETRVAVATSAQRILVLAAPGLQTLAELDGHEGVVTSVTYSRRGHLLASTSWDGTLRLWDGSSHQFLLAAAGNFDVAFQDDDRRLACISTASETTIWRLHGADEFDVLPCDKDTVNAPAMDAEERVLAAAAPAGVRLWDLRHGEPIGSFPVPGGAVSAHFTGGRASLLTWGSAGLIPWSLQWQETNGRLSPQVVPGLPIRTAGRRTRPASCAAGAGKIALITDYPRGEIVVRPLGVGPEVAIKDVRGAWSVALDPHGRLVAAGTRHGDRRVRVWNAASGELVKTLAVGADANVAMSACGELLATATSRHCTFWRTRDWSQAWSLAMENTGTAPGVVAFHPGGRLIAIRQSFTTLRLADVSAMQELAAFEPAAPAPIASLLFGPRGTHLVVGCEGQAAKVFRLPALAAALSRLGLGFDW